MSAKPEDLGSSSNVYLCIKQFNARLGDELNLKVGDKIEVLADDSEYNDGWFMGKNISTNEVGLYPKSFTQVLLAQPKSQPSLLRSRSRRLASNHSNNSQAALESPLSTKQDSLPPTPSKVNQLTSTFENLSFSPASNDAKSKKYDGTASVNRTMSDIDKALEELQSDTLKTASKHQRNPSAQSLTEDLNPKEAKSWTPKQVTSYFALVLGFDLSVAGQFARHKITGDILFELDLAHLKELDIDSFGTRFEIHKQIEKLKKISSSDHSFSANDDFTDEKPLTNITSYETSNNNSFINNSDEDYPKQPKLMPSAAISSPTAHSSSLYKHQRKRSQSMENLHSKLDDMTYESPRKPPVPPTDSPRSPGTPSQTNLNKNFKFGNSNRDSMYVTRTNALNGMSRPSSSIYDQSVASHSRNISTNSNGQGEYYGHYRKSSGLSSTAHRRHSSVFSFISGSKEEQDGSKKRQSHNLYKEGNDRKLKDQEKLISPVKMKNRPSTPKSGLPSPIPQNNDHSAMRDEIDAVDIDQTDFSPRKSKSVSYKHEDQPVDSKKDEKRAISDTGTPKSGTVSRFKTLRTASTQNFKNLTGARKQKTSAFQEGIRLITPDEAIKAASYSGWMSKRSSNNLSWRSRYFTLHGTRLSYFTSLRDKREKGLIDITAHKVIPISSEGDSDKYVALYAASTGSGRFCFKIVPPAPGFKKGLTFTQPKTHYFAVETQEEMRGWLKALMTATIDIDETVPVVSSCSTPTVSLAKAQELLAKAREETKLKDEELKEKGFLREDNNYSDNFIQSQFTSFMGSYTLDPNTSGENSPLAESMEEKSQHSKPDLSVDTSARVSRGPTTPALSAPGGFASPYLLASGLLSPKANTLSSSQEIASNNSPNSTNANFARASSAVATPVESKDQFPDVDSASSETPKAVFSNSNGRIVSGTPLNGSISSSKKKRHSEKVLAYTSDSAGNTSFVLKNKK